MREHVIFYDKMMVPNGVPVEQITKKFLKKNLLCCPGQGRLQNMIVQLHRDHQFPGDRNFQKFHDAEKCEVADNLLVFQNNQQSQTLFWSFRGKLAKS